jgi:hypothetical protein
MGEINPGVLVKIVIYALPVLLVISDLLAIHANRNDAAQRATGTPTFFTTVTYLSGDYL